MDKKVKIICTKEQWDHFLENVCPGEFSEEWKDIYNQNCEFDDTKDCRKCWDDYAEWEDIDEADA